ncbi:MAG: TraB/GumN family protein [Candidatus Polarisedimenticolaceae bacterium]|nr:TraB/GumN family protein [Gammaproteobacteria bacterium]MCF6282710.1 TraB/GumN family protein [Candidatus Polarisedimenticolaceae bacterium]
MNQTVENDQSDSVAQDGPVVTLELDGRKITLLGTAHVSKASAEQVEQMLATGDYDAVAVELCPSRHQAIANPDSLAKMDLFQVIKEGKATMVAASLALGAYQQRLADQFGIEPGAEMRMAVNKAGESHLPVLLIDREIGVTLKRVYGNIPWWKRMNLISGLIGSVVTKEKVTEEEVERLKEGDMLESSFSQFAEQSREMFIPLIDERDRYMAARIRQEMEAGEHKHLLAVLGAGHLKGIENYLGQLERNPTAEIEQLERLPTPSKWPKFIPWLIVALVLTGFAIGFSRNSELGWQLVMDWVLINGGLSALGALIAGAHPLTVLTAFVAAPLTSLNPTIGAGMVTAAVETWIRKPTVADFSAIRRDTTHLKGWWKNRVTRILLVFLLSTLGSAIGTYVAGFRILERLSG